MYQLSPNLSFGIIGVVGGGVVEGNWIAEVLRVTSRSRQFFYCGDNGSGVTAKCDT